jgi:bifunctional NMN adenylyltransferase/nudix hydrolase
MKSYSVLIGRFQPFHLGHKYCFEESLKISDETIFVIGSVNQPRSEKKSLDSRRTTCYD